MFFLDNGTLGGSLEEVLLDLDKVQRAAGELGLQLNCEKSEMICEDTTTRNAMLRAVQASVRPTETKPPCSAPLLAMSAASKRWSRWSQSLLRSWEAGSSTWTPMTHSVSCAMPSPFLKCFTPYTPRLVPFPLRYRTLTLASDLEHWPLRLSLDPSISPCSDWWIGGTKRHPACTFCLPGLRCGFSSSINVTSHLSLLWNSYFMPLCTSQLNINDSV